MTAKPTSRALIVAHGQPSDPAPAEADLALLAAAVASHLPGWHVTSATLADPDALPRALQGDAGLVYPMFMSDGWFTATHLPARLAQANAANWRILAPFGLDPEVQALVVKIALEATRGHALPLAEVLLAAHGSFRSTAPSEVAYAMAQQLRAAGLAQIEVGFIDQSPKISIVASNFGKDAVCLPFFAASGGHVIDDLPQALAMGGFSGRLLSPVGLDPRVPGLIARALLTAQSQAPAAAIG